MIIGIGMLTINTIARVSVNAVRSHGSSRSREPANMFLNPSIMFITRG